MSSSPDLPTPLAIPLKEVPNYLPKRNSKRVHRSTVIRWATKGVRGRILGTHKVGGIRYTTQAAIKQFLGISSDGPIEQQRLRNLIECMDRTQGKRT